MKNSTSIDLPKMIEHLVAEANLAYNNYLKQSTTDACLGEQIKMQKGRFGERELSEHRKAAEFLGRYHALTGVVSTLENWSHELSDELQIEPNGKKEYMIGQRVIYYDVICTVCKPERTDTSFEIWVDDPKRGYKHGVDESNLKPLPNGQL